MRDTVVGKLKKYSRYFKFIGFFHIEPVVRLLTNARKIFGKFLWNYWKVCTSISRSNYLEHCM